MRHDSLVQAKIWANDAGEGTHGVSPHQAKALWFQIATLCVDRAHSTPPVVRQLAQAHTNSVQLSIDRTSSTLATMRSSQLRCVLRPSPCPWHAFAAGTHPVKTLE